jgi:tetratricopeptide (TPR) repeat protein
MRPDTTTRVKELEDLNPDTSAVRHLAAEGWGRYEKGDVAGAAELLGEAAKHPDAAPWVLYALGFSQLALSKPAEAASSWERVRLRVPEFTNVYLDLADAYLQANDPGRAVAVLHDAEQRWPSSAEVLNALGTVQVHRGAVNDAIETFERAVTRQPDDGLAYFNLGRAYELRYFQLRRFSRPGTRWMDNPEDARRAIAAYQEYLKRGGPYEGDARRGIERLGTIR